MEADGPDSVVNDIRAQWLRGNVPEWRPEVPYSDGTREKVKLEVGPKRLQMFFKELLKTLNAKERADLAAWSAAANRESPVTVGTICTQFSENHAAFCRVQRLSSQMPAFEHNATQPFPHCSRERR